MKWVMLVLALTISGNATDLKFDSNFRNKVSVGFDGHLRYERVLPYGFHLGADLKYKIVLKGERLVHLDQQPETYLLTASHLWNNKFLILENRINFGDFDGYISLTFDSGIRKQIRFESRWAIAPFIKIIEYVFDPGAFDEEWPSRRVVHHGELKTLLGIELELFF